MRDLTLAHSAHINDALQKIMDARFQTPFATLASLSLCAEQIANALSDAQHIQTGAEPRKLSEQLPAQSAHFRHLAEQAIRTLDPGCYQESIEHAVAEMVNGQFTRHMSVEETARETLSIFLAHFARPVVVPIQDEPGIVINGERFTFAMDDDDGRPAPFWNGTIPDCPECGNPLGNGRVPAVNDGRGGVAAVECGDCGHRIAVTR